ncbi:hypothetical protein DSCO28_41020 [Desulfosarcina ovata subsp. sediminis]|uniref:Flagellar assembly protein T N-terminal domain-containing protein n=1 Tax=Desulfosarcina ovata subsp. sediminis TaxID=885957 RepID=A0A5K7ZTH5_9BACT|nr:hypothetical protein [Desulfosarcina ovata]BBO83536.1 hypothetical protein DSCO28_41020 [Desulfosarcina ovata subsp. sediminis]
MTAYRSIHRWMLPIALLLIVTIGFAGSGIAAEATTSLNAFGAAVIHNKNMAAGKQSAIDDALVAAVGGTVMEMLTRETVVRRFQVINEKILNAPDTYVRNYRVVSEAVSGSTVRVLVQVDVATGRLGSDLSRLGLAMADTVLPRVLFMVAEKNVDDADLIDWWGAERRSSRTVSEGALADAFKADGFGVVDVPDPAMPLGIGEPAADADLLALAGRLGADVLVVGTGTATQTPGGDHPNAEAEVRVRALNVRSGAPMGKSQGRSPAADPAAQRAGRQALSNAASAAADDLIGQVLAAWQQDQDRHARIELVVDGTSGQIASFVRLRTAISSLPGVKDLKMVKMSGDQAVMAVRYAGTPRSLADALLLETFNGFGIEIDEVTDGAVHVRLVQP